MAPPVFVTPVTTVAPSNRTSLAVPIPSGIALNDLIIVAIYVESATVSYNGPAGENFALVPPSPTITSGGNVNGSHVFWKRADASDVNSTGTWTFTSNPSTSVYCLAVAARITGASIDTNPFEGAVEGANATASNNTPSLNLTTTDPERLIVWVGTNFGAGSWTPPSGFTERYDTGNIELSVATRDAATAGIISNIVGSSTVSNSTTAFAFAIEPGSNVSNRVGTETYSLTENDSIAQSSSRTDSANLTESASVFPLVLRSSTDSAQLSEVSELDITIHKSSSDTAFTLTEQPAQVFASVWGMQAFTFGEFSTPGFTRETISRIIDTNILAFTHPTRIIVQRIRDKKFLHWDFPLQDVEITYTLSGPQIIKGIFRNEVTELRDMGLVPYGVMLHVEDEGNIVASGILQPFSDQKFDEELPMEAFGVSSYPIGIPYLGELSVIQTDPVQIIDTLWDHMQSFPDADLGVTIRGASSARVGKPLPPPPPDPLPDNYVDPNPDDDDDKPFELMWYEGPDCGDTITSLVQENGFDFIERQQWNADKTDVLHYIDHADRIGTRRNDLTFIEGENIVSPVFIQEDSSLYASEVWVFGAGEGRDVVKGFYGTPNQEGRIRRVAIVQDNTIKTKTEANKQARYEYMRRQAFNDVGEIELNARHINAPIGSFIPGDDVMLNTEVPWRGEIRQWERIISFTFFTNDDRIVAAIRRAECFNNGG